MNSWTETDRELLLEKRKGPCVSIFLPINPHDSHENRIRFRNLISEAEQRLQMTGMRPSSARELLTPLRELQEDSVFWRNPSTGVAVFLAPDFLKVCQIPLSFSEELEVGSTFLVIPLLPLLTDEGHFFVLAVSQNTVRLFRGTRFTINQIDLSGVPLSLEEAMRTHDRDKVLSFHTETAPNGALNGRSGGFATGTDDEKSDLLRFFQMIDHGLHPIFREEKAPLILAAVGYLHSIYQRASTYSKLTAHGIIGNPDRMSGVELHELAWKIAAPQSADRSDQAVSQYQEALLNGKATDTSASIIPAAIRGEISTLFISLDERVRGTLDFEQNLLTIHDHAVTGDEDLSNLAAVHMMRHRRRVFAFLHGEMPVPSRLAAISFRPLAEEATHLP